jgi:prolyl-tRNA editing enzyme YbaK/EbsC (Cys-tRNA(Pro) deacylase)
LLLDSGTSTQGSPVKSRGERGAQTIGGVAPIGHPSPLRTIVDTDLGNFDEVWAAGGHPHYVFPTSFDELVRITSGTPADVGA